MQPYTATVYDTRRTNWWSAKPGVSSHHIHGGPGLKLSSWLRRRGCDQRTINQITARRFRYGSYRPSDRAALLVDASPVLTPYADEPLVVAAD